MCSFSPKVGVEMDVSCLDAAILVILLEAHVRSQEDVNAMWGIRVPTAILVSVDVSLVSNDYYSIEVEIVVLSMCF